MKKNSILLLILVWSASTLLWGQNLTEVVQWSHSGQHAKAERVLATLQAEQPANPEITLARAYNLSWMGKQNEAVTEFQKAIRYGADPATARTGMGYAAAFGRHFSLANQTFRKVLQQQPGHQEAARGLALTRFWQGSYQEAIRLLGQQTEAEPNAYDLHIALGLAQLHSGTPEEARSSFQRALDIQPASAEAKQLIGQTYVTRPFLETNLWLGFTRLDNSENEAGLRGVQATLKWRPDTRLWFRYDNSLALDILQFARAGRAAPLFAAGMSRQWDVRFISELEYGVRSLENQSLQHLVSGAQVWFLPGNARLNAGGFVGFGAARPVEWMGYGSINLPAGRNFRIEPTYFFIQPTPGANEHRAQLGLQYRSHNNAECSVYGLYGQTMTPGGENDSSVYGWSVVGAYPLGRVVSAQAVVRHEQSDAYRFTTAALGVQLRFHK